MAVRGKKDQFWEMRSGGPYDQPGESREIFKCTGCGAETYAEKGWNGEPTKHHCSGNCPFCNSDWKIGSGGAYRNNFDSIFPNAPGAGL